jgi:hypothetical protein
MHHVRVRPRPQQFPHHTRVLVIEGRKVQSRQSTSILVVDVAAAMGQEQGHDIRMAYAIAGAHKRRHAATRLGSPSVRPMS